MFVCICNAITDHKIKEAVASGANSLTDLKDQLGVATCCGCCADLATSFLTANAGNAHTQMHSSITVER
ncbi:bacterioferritin-associated ferredoxin [Kingella denitrificans]|uniref:Bacterioferritin-associated ferredoxin n=1 Tax=Kingella denitrificans ATCC 33394 TaxID=888741 RepID=F0EZP6_9NEIS|nr:(2Fe-2S)-binding protein [Kingella denitrificans]EGC17215.1 [2Fe-2S]-binding domain protein [Kingella denitrificans ATCC 33394]QQB41826.1 (2Fe-2S)-binding protein [Kingella denitrificans]STR12299.1 bacterioferritin-associated ferredoxin [Kingella denitrificans]